MVKNLTALLTALAVGAFVFAPAIGSAAESGKSSMNKKNRVVSSEMNVNKGKINKGEFKTSGKSGNLNKEISSSKMTGKKLGVSKSGKRLGEREFASSKHGRRLTYTAEYGKRSLHRKSHIRRLEGRRFFTGTFENGRHLTKLERRHLMRNVENRRFYTGSFERGRHFVRHERGDRFIERPYSGYFGYGGDFCGSYDYGYGGGYWSGWDNGWNSSCCWGY